MRDKLCLFQNIDIKTHYFNIAPIFLKRNTNIFKASSFQYYAYSSEADYSHLRKKNYACFCDIADVI